MDTPLSCLKRSWSRPTREPAWLPRKGDIDTYQAQFPREYQEIAWRTLRESLEELVEEAEKQGVTIGLEPVCVHTLSTSERMVQLLHEIPSPCIGVVFDPCNLLTQQSFDRQTEFVQSALECLSERMVLAHLKDVRYRPQGRLQFATPGTGNFDTPSFFSTMREIRLDVDVSLEECTENDLNAAIHVVREQASACGFGM